MFLLFRPTAREIKRFLSSQRQTGFSYPEVGSTRGPAPSGYDIDHNRIRLGYGADAFHRAVGMLNEWRMFDLGWVEIFPKNVHVEPGATVAVLAHHLGFSSLNATRVVYVSREDRSFRFAYGTLQDHAEQGEERFSIEWSQDDSIWFDIYAFSRPKQWQAKIARPVCRRLQKKFAHDSKMAMMKACRYDRESESQI
jgi:uncharacterized protein (UPF0548 family)